MQSIQNMMVGPEERERQQKAKEAHLSAPCQYDVKNKRTDPRTNVQMYLDFTTELEKKRKTWEEAQEKYKAIQKTTTDVGTDTGSQEAFRKMNMAQNDYFGLFEYAMSKEQGAAREFLSGSDWALLAGVENETNQEARKKAIDKYKEDNYKEFEGVITPAQFERAKMNIAPTDKISAYFSKKWASLWRGEYEVAPGVGVSEAEIATFKTLHGDKGVEDYFNYMAAGLMLPTVLHADVAEYLLDTKHKSSLPIQLDSKYDIGEKDQDGKNKEKLQEETFKAVTLGSIYNYHNAARQAARYNVGVTAMSEFGEYVEKGVTDLSDKLIEDLKKIPGNENIDPKKEPFMVNGITIQRQASINMFRMRVGWSLGSFAFGDADRMSDVSRFAVSWVEATAEANGISKYDVVNRLYSTDATVQRWDEKNGELVDSPNENLRKADGSPINVFPIRSVPMTGGEAAALATIADTCVLMEAMSIKTEVDAKAIQDNAASISHELRNPAISVIQEWARTQVALKQAAKQRLTERYGLTGDPKKDKEILMRAFFGPELHRDEAAVAMAIREKDKAAATLTAPPKITPAMAASQLAGGADNAKMPEIQAITDAQLMKAKDKLKNAGGTSLTFEVKSGPGPSL